MLILNLQTAFDALPCFESLSVAPGYFLSSSRLTHQDLWSLNSLVLHFGRILHYKGLTDMIWSFDLQRYSLNSTCHCRFNRIHQFDGLQRGKDAPVFVSEYAVTADGGLGNLRVSFLQNLRASQHCRLYIRSISSDQWVLTFVERLSSPMAEYSTENYIWRRLLPIFYSVYSTVHECSRFLQIGLSALAMLNGWTQ